MPVPNCKDCVHFDEAYGLPGRCVLVLERIEEKLKEGTANSSDILYYIRQGKYDEDYWQWPCEQFEQKGKRTNREALNAMSNEQLAKFMNHIDCSMCAYYADPDTEPDYVCAKHHERALAISSDDHEAASRICIDGLAKWLDQEEAWFMKEEQK